MYRAICENCHRDRYTMMYDGLPSSISAGPNVPADADVFALEEQADRLVLGGFPIYDLERAIIVSVPDQYGEKTAQALRRQLERVVDKPVLVVSDRVKILYAVRQPDARSERPMPVRRRVLVDEEV